MPECVAISFSRARNISSTTNLAVWEKALNMKRRKPHHQGEAWRPQSMITTRARTEQGENCRTLFSCPFPWGPPFLGEIASFSARASVTVIPTPRALGITIAQHISTATEPAFPGGSEVKASACNVGDLGLIPGSGRSPGEAKQQPTPVFSPGESPGRRSLVSNSPRGRKEWTRRSGFTSSEPASFLPAPPAPSSYRNTPLGLLFVQLKCSTQPTVLTEPLVIWCHFTGATFLSRPRTQNSAAEFEQVGAVHQLLPLAPWLCFHSLFHNTGN